MAKKFITRHSIGFRIPATRFTYGISGCVALTAPFCWFVSVLQDSDNGELWAGGSSARFLHYRRGSFA